MKHVRSLHHPGAICNAQVAHSWALVDDVHDGDCEDCLDLYDADRQDDVAGRGDPELLDLLRAIRDQSPHPRLDGKIPKIDGQVIDTLSANVMVIVAEALDEVRQKKFLALPIVIINDRAWKYVRRTP